MNKDEYNLSSFKLSSLIREDSHSIDGFYNIKSLYFDYPSFKCANDVEQGKNVRYKYRIRYYNDDFNKLFLEKKTKINGICYKNSIQLNKELYGYILNEETEKILFKDKLLDELAIEIIKNRLGPKIIVEYRRKAFVEPISNTRITFDDNIKISEDYENFLEATYLSRPLLSDDEKIMEVKFDKILPAYIKKICQYEGCVQTSFSKYYLAYSMLHGGKINEHYKYY